MSKLDLQFIGHEENWQKLTNQVDQGKLPSTLLFYGTMGIGKKLLAIQLIQYLFCQKNLDQAQNLFGEITEVTHPCLMCESCLKVKNNSHPDFFLIEPENQSIKINQIRELQKQIVKTSLESAYKVVLINDAQYLNQASSNALLKTLEEPPLNTHFILITPGLFQVLPTIRSRAWKMYFSSPNREEVIEQAKQFNNHPDLMSDYELVGGSIGLLEKFYEEDFVKIWSQLKHLLNDRPDFEKINQLVNQMVKEDIDLDFLIGLIQREIFLKLKQDPQNIYLEKIDFCYQAKKDLRANVQKNLLFENLFLNILPV